MGRWTWPFPWWTQPPSSQGCRPRAEDRGGTGTPPPPASEATKPGVSTLPHSPPSPTCPARQTTQHFKPRTFSQKESSKPAHIFSHRPRVCPERRLDGVSVPPKLLILGSQRAVPGHPFVVGSLMGKGRGRAWEQGPPPSPSGSRSPCQGRAPGEDRVGGPSWKQADGLISLSAASAGPPAL